MGTRPPRFGTFVWWLISVAICLVISVIGAEVVRQPPFTDSVYIVMQSLIFPAALIFVFKWLLPLLKD